MAIPGQRFELDLESDDFAIKPLTDDESQGAFVVKQIQEHDVSGIPQAPKFKPSKSGFPDHKSRRNVSAFKQKQQANRSEQLSRAYIAQVEPSDQAVRHHIGKQHGIDFEAQQKSEISRENRRRIAEMSAEDIEEARAELLKSLDPGLIERMLKRANIDEDQHQPDPQPQPLPQAQQTSKSPDDEQGPADPDPVVSPTTPLPHGGSVHFPVPPHDPSTYKPLDPSSSTFLADLRTTYFPSLSHDPSSLSWLQDPSPEEISSSPYNPSLAAYPASSLRFNFVGRLIPPTESLSIPVSAGLHHHGDAPSSAGYTVPELTLLARSAMPNQRCVAYQTVGRILYRLGKGEFGPRASEVEEAIWNVIEHERVLELIMAEANKQGGHASAKAHATEALWLWRKGGGGDRGVLKVGETRAK